MQCFVCGVSALLWPWSAAFIMNTYSSLTLMLSVLHSALPIKPSFPLSSSLLLAPQTGNRCPSFPVSVHSREPGQCGYIYSYTRTQQYNTRSPLSRKHIRNREQQRRTNRRQTNLGSFIQRETNMTNQRWITSIINAEVPFTWAVIYSLQVMERLLRWTHLSCFKTVWSRRFQFRVQASFVQLNQAVFISLRKAKRQWGRCLTLKLTSQKPICIFTYELFSVY